MSFIIVTISIRFRAEKEYAILSQKLSEELDEKKSIINKLSKQLGLHQDNFNDLKDELNKVRNFMYLLRYIYTRAKAIYSLIFVAPAVTVV